MALCNSLDREWCRFSPGLTMLYPVNCQVNYVSIQYVSPRKGVYKAKIIESRHSVAGV